VNVAYHWMTALQESHFAGVGLSLLLILIMSILVFRSPTVGVIAVVPVTFTVLCIYGVMGSLGVYLEPATSMFAAISVGVGVDFAIHLVDRLQMEKRTSSEGILNIVATVVPGTARACFFNAAALGVGFSVLMVSDLPMLQRFGGLVTVAALASFLAALIIVPACYALLERRRAAHGIMTKPAHMLLPVTLALACIAPDSLADSTADEGLRIAQAVADRAEATAVTRTIDMTLTDKRGRVSARIRGEDRDLRLPGEPDLSSYSKGTRPHTVNRYWLAELRDAYVDASLPNGQLRLGKQQIVWGALDGIKVLDALNPQSFERFILEDFDDSRIGLWSAHLDLTLGAWRTELALIPDTTTHYIPEPGAWMAFTAPRYRFGLPDTGAALQLQRDEPEKDNPSAGLRISRYIGGVDVQFIAISGLDFEPLGRLSVRNGTPLVTTYHEQRQLYGVSAETSFSAFALRTEISFSPQRFCAVT